MPTITVVGPGRAGGALAIALSRAGWKIRLIYRDHPPKNLAAFFDPETFVLSENAVGLVSDFLILAVPDPEIRPVAEYLASIGVRADIALHLSGSLAAGEIKVLRSTGADIASVHPLLSISDPVVGADLLAGAYFCIEGEPKAVDSAQGLVRSLGGSHFTIASQFKPLYHAAAVMTSGHVVALLDCAIDMLAACGLDHGTAKKVLFPLTESAVRNLSVQDAENALTGPFARGDAEAVRRHIDSIGIRRPGVLESYLALAARSIEIVSRNGNQRRAVEDLAEIVSVAKGKAG